jgi:Xaa-Pro aminopeptidase
VIDFAGLKIDALLVSGLPNIRYLSGFTGSNGLLLVMPDSQTLFTDPRYTIQASEECRCAVRTVKGGPLHQAVAQLIQRQHLKKIGFEKARLSYEDYAALREALPLGASLKPVAGAIEKMRMIKSEDEIARIRRSVLTNSEAFQSTLKRIRAGISESDVAAELEYQMRLHGAEKPAFETIVAGGAHSALPHARPTRQILNGNELILIDMGSCQDGYTSDMTRMLFLGRPDQKTRSMYNAVLEAQLAAISAVREGVTAQQIDRSARRVLKGHGLEKEFVHSTGHGLGLEIHEPPRIGGKEKTKLAAGMVITIEPGAYVRGLGGVRIEDTVAVTKNGCEILTPTAKELMLL